MTVERIAEELARYPLTARFLMGRMRHAMGARERELVENLVEHTESCAAPRTIVERGQLLDRGTIVISGFVARVVPRGDARHIVGLHVPGDFADLHSYPLKRLDHHLVTVGPARLGYVPHARLNALFHAEPHLARLMWSATLLHAAIHREWIVGLEEHTADERLAHLLAETWRRLDFVGLADEDGFDLPLSQIELSSACGTTAVHMNRTVRSLREAGIAEIRRGRVTIPDRARLEALGGFEPSYLYGQGALNPGDEPVDGG